MRPSVTRAQTRATSFRTPKPPLRTSAAFVLALCAIVALPRAAAGADYEVGPGQKYGAIAEVPWESLAPGDTVSIHWRPEPYREKWVICRRGAEGKPIVVRGVPGPDGQLPVIDGRDATTPPALDYWGGERSVIKIGGANKPADTMPAHVVIKNLDVRSGRPPFSFTGRKGAQKYGANAASVFIEKGEHITIRHCTLHDSGNGLFVSKDSRDVLVESCAIGDNGVELSIYQHNSYTEADGITFQFNRFGPLRFACPGNNLKDRSAGLVVRYNWIEGGNRALDLVDAEDSAELRAMPAYRTTFVYGNVLFKRDDAINNQVVHYGGDSGKTEWYRKGMLHFFNNTVVSQRSANTTLFGLSTNDEHVDCRNNIFHAKSGGAKLAIDDGPGVVDLLANWLTRGWVKCHGRLTGETRGTETAIAGDAPGFVDEAHGDFHLAPDSPCRGAGVALHPDALPTHTVTRQYLRDQSSEPRMDDKKPDLGAFGPSK
jgi:parallel beta helix pectate lyase-like protein